MKNHTFLHEWPAAASGPSAGQIREREAAPALTRDGMPASPHQIAVLSRPAAEAASASRRIEDAMSQVGPVTRAQ